MRESKGSDFDNVFFVAVVCFFYLFVVFFVCFF